MTAPTQRPASHSEGRKRAQEKAASVATPAEPDAEAPGRCWRSECRTACYYPDVCSERTPTPAGPDVDERERLAELIWNVSRRDEGTISATGANIVADAILAAGYSRTPDAHLAAAKAEGAAEALEDLQERLVAAEQRLAELTYPYWQKQDSDRLEGKRQGIRLALSYVEEAARLREQGGE